MAPRDWRPRQMVALWFSVSYFSLVLLSVARQLSDAGYKGVAIAALVAWCVVVLGSALRVTWLWFAERQGGAAESAGRDAIDENGCRSFPGRDRGAGGGDRDTRPTRAPLSR
jgi:hypothetical protein